MFGASGDIVESNSVSILSRSFDATFTVLRVFFFFLFVFRVKFCPRPLFLPVPRDVTVYESLISIAD